MKIAYFYDDVYRAAKWIHDNNPACRSYYDAEDNIYRSIYYVCKAIKNDSDFAITGTFGYYVIATYEDKDLAVVQILVDPTVGKRKKKGVHCVSEKPETIMEFLEDYAQV